MQSPILEAREVTKQFNGVVALDGVSFALQPGEVHALVGENGAGKSTLIKALTGAHRLDGGAVRFDGVEVAFTSPREAQNVGISTIYQEINLVPLFSVAQNMFLGREPRNRFGWIDNRKMNLESGAILKRYGIDVDVSAPVWSLGLGIQQMVAIARAVSIDARVVIMDEPTSSLDTQEVETLFRVIRQLQSDGVSMIYVSHRLDELYEICQRVTVMRDGRVIHTGPLHEMTKLDLISMMIGRQVTQTHKEHYTDRTPDANDVPLLRVQNLRKRRVVKDVTFDVYRGEIVGLGGLLGCGRTETAKAIFGVEPTTGGKLEINGEPIRLTSPSAAIAAGISYLSEDRKSEGILPNLSIRDNIIAAALPRISKFGIISSKAQDEIVRTFINRLGIKASSPEQLVSELSGGNQQKVLLARWLCLNPRLVVLDDPTRGIDVGAKSEVMGLVRELAEKGLGIVIMCSDMEEILEASDRLIVLKDGQTVGTLVGDLIHDTNFMAMLAGHLRVGD